MLYLSRFIHAFRLFLAVLFIRHTFNISILLNALYNHNAIHRGIANSLTHGKLTINAGNDFLWILDRLLLFNILLFVFSRKYTYKPFFNIPYIIGHTPNLKEKNNR